MEPSISNIEQKTAAEVHVIRKVTSLSALRGRSVLPRTSSGSSGDGSASAASKFSRAASLGRYSKTTTTKNRQAPAEKKWRTSSPFQRRRRSCGYRVAHALSSHQGGVGGVVDVEHTNETRASWALGRLSIVFLLLVTFTDTAFKSVNDQMSQIESHDYYDALSPDVIRPAFLYKSSTGMNIEKPSLGLGSAAISSITEALGPILPFTGGVDLRRDEYYGGTIFENLYNLAQQTYKAYENAKEDKEGEPQTTGSSNSSKRKLAPSSSPKKGGNKKYALALGASDPFVSLDKIGQLTLRDLSAVFEYATRRTDEGFNHGKYQNGALPRVKTVIQAMESAVSKSRGQGIDGVAKFSSKETSSGNMDAFFFCAVMRVFAEWRILRQVPEGYKGYAVGMTLGQKDVVQNVAKMERAAQALVDQQVEFLDSPVMSPTLRDVLQYEIDIGEHAKLPRLKETSGAMGLLWVRRQLLYQTVIFENISKYPTAREAVSAAYEYVYGQYHGWAVQKIFSYSFQASPPAEEIYKFMNPHRLAEVQEIAQNMNSKEADCPRDEDKSPSEKAQTHTKNQSQPPENIFHRIGFEFDKFMDCVGQHVDAIGHHLGRILPKDKKAKKVQSGEGLIGAELEEFIGSEMEKNVHEHVISYLDVVQPLLGDLADLIDELNMDDPTKV